MSKQQSFQHPDPASSGPNTFLANLRLLDLHKLDDWPPISVQTIASRDTGPSQKARVQCAEWALYRLFEIWSPVETQDKLLPFFPPFEPLQSLNLRAALFRSLNNLKQDGTLGKDIILRKTMFDDCKGERFLEVLLAFSTIVLRKALTQDRTSNASITGQLCSAERVPPKDLTSFLPLAIAHRVALRRILERKQQLRARYHEFGSVMDVKDRELDRKFAKVIERQQFLDQNIASEATVSRVAKQFEQHWQSDRRYIDVIAQGEEFTLKDHLLDTPIQHQWREVSNGTFEGDLSTSRHGLLEDLEKRVAVQNERLQQWRDFKTDIQKDGKFAASSKKTSLFSPRVNGAHPGLSDEKDLVFSPRKSPRKSEWPVMIATEESLSVALPHVSEQSQAMQDDTLFHTKSTPIGKLPKDAFLKRRRSPIAPSSLGHSSADGSNDSGLSEIDKGVILNDTVVPVLNADNSNINYKPFQVDSDHSSFSIEHPNIQDDSKWSQNAKNHRESSQPRHEDQLRPTVMKQSSGRTSTSSKMDEDCSSEDQTALPNEEAQLAEQIIALTLNAAPTPMKPRPLSLMERTRQSMAFASPGARLTTMKATSQPPISRPDNPDPVIEEVVLPGARLTLPERTRQSISLVSSKPKGPRKSITKHDHRRSSKIYPTNQFETPSKGQSTIRELTPPEELFSPGAGYDSVFKSRPKIAFSPTTGTTPEPTSSDAEDGASGGVMAGGKVLQESPSLRLIAKT